MTAGAAGGSWDDAIVLCATTRFDGMPMGDWHLARALSELAPVLFVDPPMSRLTPLRHPEAAAALARPRLTLPEARIARLTPVVAPFPSRPGMAGLTTALTRQYLRRAVSALQAKVSALITGWPLYPVRGACGERASIYWAKDDFAGGAWLLGENARQLGHRERRVAAAADLVVAASPLVASTWKDRGLSPALIPFGTDAAAYLDVDSAPLPADVRLPHPVAGFIGRINERTDLALLEAIADRGRSLLLVGPKEPSFAPGRFAALTARPNVCWTGAKPFRELPGYLRIIDVGLVPYADSAFNRGSFPLKTLEYLAAGRAVVTTDLPAIRWLDTDLIRIAAGPADFASQVDRLAAAGRTPELTARRREFAGTHSWADRARAFHAAIVALCQP
ncbi:MAG TPA: glycosyltransferase [Streptosporangiaceae bacterium]|nr:glycosyltransferase [Streptosporangiaceae bacterium]